MTGKQRDLLQFSASWHAVAMSSNLYFHIIVYNYTIMNGPDRIELDHLGANLSTDGITPERHAYTTPDNRQTIRMIVADGRPDKTEGSGQTIIWPASFGSRADRLEAVRTNILAARLEARVAYVETPGVSIDINDVANTDAGHLSASQLLSVANGNFAPLARLQLEALDDALQFDNEQELRLIGYSMACWSAVSMAKVVNRRTINNKKIEITDMDLFEPVNDQNYRLDRLHRDIDREEPFGTRYFIDENGELGLDVLPFDRESDEHKALHTQLTQQQSLAINALSLGLRRGFSRDLAQVVSRSNLNQDMVHMWWANESLVSRSEAHLHTAKQLGEVGCKAALTEIHPTADYRALGHHHAIPHSIGTVANLAQHYWMRGVRVAA